MYQLEEKNDFHCTVTNGCKYSDLWCGKYYVVVLHLWSLPLPYLCKVLLQFSRWANQGSWRFNDLPKYFKTKHILNQCYCDAKVQCILLKKKTRKFFYYLCQEDRRLNSSFSSLHFQSLFSSLEDESYYILKFLYAGCERMNRIWE